MCYHSDSFNGVKFFSFIMANRYTTLGYATGAFKQSAPTRARADRREPDAKTNEAFAKIHQNRERFSVSAINAALAKARSKID